MSVNPVERRQKLLLIPEHKRAGIPMTNHKAIAKRKKDEGKKDKYDWAPKMMSRKDANLGKITVYGNGFKLGTMPKLHRWSKYKTSLRMLQQGKLSEQLVEVCEIAWGSAFAAGTLALTDRQEMMTKDERGKVYGKGESPEQFEDRPRFRVPKTFTLWQPNPAIAFMSSSLIHGSKGSADEAVNLQLVTFPRKRSEVKFSRQFTIGELYTYTMNNTNQNQFGLFYGFPPKLLHQLDVTLYDRGLDNFCVYMRIPEMFPSQYRHIWTEDEEDDY